MKKEYDLFESQNLQIDPNVYEVEQPEIKKILVWQELQSKGFLPAAREGHSAGAVGSNIYVFGGMETGKRVNSTLTLDVLNKKWEILKTSGALPSPRCFHASCVYKSLYFIHGGEGKLNEQEAYVSSDKNYSLSKLGIENINSASRGTEGICPGDSISGGRIGPSMKFSRGTGSISGEETNFNIGLDDFYCLDTNTNTWIKIKSHFSPLSRKGHSLNVVNSNNKELILLFGGYSIEHLTFSNSILVCSIDSLMDYYLNESKHLKASNNSTNKINDIKQLKWESTQKPVEWRSLSTKGMAPSPRYRHSSVFVQRDINSNIFENMLFISGGIGKDSSSPFQDVHILYLDSLTWTSPVTGNDGLARGVAGDGPFEGIYGHCSILSSNSLCEAEIIVFGGSSNISASHLNCYQTLFGFNALTHVWRKISTGYLFPAARNNHSFTIVKGWSPQNINPLSSSNIDSVMHKDDSSEKFSAFLFGGVSSVMASSDTWILDLEWKSAGVEQYETSIIRREEDLMSENHIASNFSNKNFFQSNNSINDIHANSNIAKVQKFNSLKYLNKLSSSNLSRIDSQSKGFLQNSYSETKFEAKIPKVNYSQNQINSSSLDNLHNINRSSSESPPRAFPNNNLLLTKKGGGIAGEEEEEGEKLNDLILFMRRDRAQVEMQLKNEKEKSRILQIELDSTKEELVTYQQQIVRMKENYENEIRELKSEIYNSKKREEQLKTLNDEVFEIMALNKINSELDNDNSS